MLQHRKIVLVGSPNVGKSVIFNYFTGTYVTVSNYPGTTVDITRGRSSYHGVTMEVVDTPGIYSIIPFTDEERVTRELLEREAADVVIHVVDAKNLRRMLPLTIQFIEAGLPVILNINLMDEAEERGIRIHSKRLAEILEIPVVATAAVKHIGLEELKRSAVKYKPQPERVPFRYSSLIEDSINRIAAELEKNYPIGQRAIALLLLQGDRCTLTRLDRQQPFVLNTLYRCLDRFYEHPEYSISKERQAFVDEILSETVRIRPTRRIRLSDRLGQLTREPVIGIPILLFVLYWGLYQFVGRFGAGFLVDYVDKVIFAGYISPLVEWMAREYIPWDWGQSLIVGSYGLFSLGIRYAVVIVLPIVGTFFLMFAVLEDSGYLPRLAMLVDRIFKKFGLNGRAIIPVTLGLGCGTMAVMVTRTLETKRERVLATFLLALAIPCSAQLGVVMALLSHNAAILCAWALYIACMFILAGWVTARMIPGEKSAFYMELPPLRTPIISNVLKKAYTRMAHYFTEILPIFVLTSLVLWFSEWMGILPLVLQIVAPMMELLGLPPEAADIFIGGFLRRDYGAAGLYDMAAQGLLTDHQLLVAAVTLTLFVPCIAQFMVMLKERGPVTTTIMVLAIILIAFSSGVVVNRMVLSWL
jgi:ferrous iron transport protein B